MHSEADRLLQARKTFGLTQEQVATRIGITRTGYVHLERRNRTPSMRVARALSALFGLPIDWLFPGPQEQSNA